MINALALADTFWPSEPCPTCEKPFDKARPIHRECLTERCGGKIPDEIERLIEMFELEPEALDTTDG